METKTKNQLHTATERNMYARDQLVTLSDPDQFRNDLLKKTKYLLTQKSIAPEKQWLKSFEVQKLPKISAGTLQHLRDTGQLPFTKLGSIIYYEHEAIRNIMGKR